MKSGLMRSMGRSKGARRGPAFARLGMTLIEMMVVIVVIAVLFSIMMPAVSRLRQRAHAADAEATRAVLRDAILQYHFEYGRWPVEDDILDQDDGATFAEDNYVVFDYMEEHNPKGIPFIYIEDYDTDPESGAIVDPWGDPYEIRFNFNENTVTVRQYQD